MCRIDGWLNERYPSRTPSTIRSAATGRYQCFRSHIMMNPMVLNATIVFPSCLFTNGLFSNTNSKLNKPQTAIITVSLMMVRLFFLKKAVLAFVCQANTSPVSFFAFF
jgi:hypothetical protein